MDRVIRKAAIEGAALDLYAQQEAVRRCGLRLCTTSTGSSVFPPAAAALAEAVSFRQEAEAM